MYCFSSLSLQWKHYFRLCGLCKVCFYFILFIYLFIFILGFTALSRTFTYIRPVVHWRSASTGEPGENHLTSRQLNLSFSRDPSEARTDCGELWRIDAFNHKATEARYKVCIDLKSWYVILSHLKMMSFTSARFLSPSSRFWFPVLKNCYSTLLFGLLS